ncbi:TM2 domain-containing protein [Corynebacterium propinquum]|uniref:TM2 domain-containing protein n=1 Tax=Corynebacterium propinquum TaxID=43769 RepID=A0AAP4F996_9CORY|nr:TM2 domain-containing protein [Corynebacterium propinquum]MCG7231255.1 TM2 domain-containing protein [Corynebacterium propinquum]MDK4325103.1 TM2 domain-containing protein [Corynebacterium propinquum]MDK8721999.1 TM2 domain-containing protein [Corynebacterium propinquum]
MNSQDHGYNKYSRYDRYDNDGLPTENYSGYSNNSGYSFDAGNDASQYSPAQRNNYGYQGQGMQQNIQYGDPQLPYPGYKQKSMLAAALLAFFLGSLGVHNFYLGNTKKAVTQLVMCLLGYITAIILIGFLVLGALYIWVIVEFVLIVARSGDYATDSNGVPLD